MLFRNFTPFPPLHFQSRDVNQEDFGVVVLRGSFQLVNNHPLKLVQKQEPLVMVDEYHGNPKNSSLKIEHNIAPYKPRTDIHINATAFAPGGKPLPYWKAGVSLGEKVKKELLITGPRYWKYNWTGGWELTESLPVAQVPIHYEQAYGGSWQNGKELHAFPENPIGLGYVNKELLNKDKLIPAPQILPIDNPFPKMEKGIKVEGLGPLGASWQPRLRFAGTFNVIWEKTRWPDLPEDFKFDFYNSAHPDLIYPGFVHGNEEIQLINLSPESNIRFSLPGYTLALLIRWEDGRIAPAPMALDTIHIDTKEMKTYLVWRGLFPVGKPIRVLEARMKMPGKRE